MFFTKSGGTNTNMYGVASIKPVVQQQVIQQAVQQQVIQQQVIQQPVTKKMIWGEPTWVLFHTLAEKIKDEHFQQIRVELLDLIYSICSNLPCPDCANHASSYMNNINYSTIRTKTEFKQMLYQFHNMVNKKKNVPIPSITILDKYKDANLISVLYAFMTIFQDKHKSIRMISNDFHRSRITLIIKSWFNKNIQYFNY